MGGATSVTIIKNIGKIVYDAQQMTLEQSRITPNNGKMGSTIQTPPPKKNRLKGEKTWIFHKLTLSIV